jgi:hypothetical protein
MGMGPVTDEEGVDIAEGGAPAPAAKPAYTELVDKDAYKQMNPAERKQFSGLLKKYRDLEAGKASHKKLEKAKKNIDEFVVSIRSKRKKERLVEFKDKATAKLSRTAKRVKYETKKAIGTAGDFFVENVMPTASAVMEKGKEKATEIGKKLKDVASNIVETVGDRNAFLSKMPEKYRDQIGKIYDGVKSGKDSTKAFFNKVSKQFGENKHVKKLIDTAKKTADTITDPIKRREFIEAAMNHITNVYDTVKDKDKRDQAIAEAKDKIQEYLGIASGESSEAAQTEEKASDEPKSIWEQIKESFGKAKASIKDGFKTGWESVKAAFKGEKTEDKSKEESVKKDAKSEEEPKGLFGKVAAKIKNLFKKGDVDLFKGAPAP